MISFYPTRFLKISDAKLLKEFHHRFFEWFQLSETQDSSFPDDKKYTMQEIEESIKGLNIKIEDFPFIL
jgi:hypothetical protein